METKLSQRPEFPTLKQFLREDDEDIVFGLRRLLSDIQSTWRSNRSATKAEQLKLWKKLSPDQQQDLNEQFHLVLLSAIGDAMRPLKISGFNPTSKIEANFIVATFMALTKDVQHIGRSLLGRVAAGPSPIIDDAKEQQLLTDFAETKMPVERPLGPVTLKFVTEHKDQLLRLLVDEDAGAFGLNVNTIPRALDAALQKTPADKREEALLGIHYLLTRMAFQFSQAATLLGNQFSRKSLPEEPPKKP